MNKVSFPNVCIFMTTLISVLPGFAEDIPLPGDFNGDEQLTMADVDLLTRSGNLGADGYVPDEDSGMYDLDFNGKVNQEDVFLLVSWITFYNPLEDTIGFCEAGDYTGDGVIDIDDWNYQTLCYIFWFNSQGVWIFQYTLGDCNGDNAIDALDYRVLCSNWTDRSNPPPSIPSFVPR